MSNFIIIATCKEVRANSGVIVMDDGLKVVVIDDEDGWVSHTTRSLRVGETIPKRAKTFPTREEAEAFAKFLDSDEAKNDRSWWRTWHPWYVQPKSWEVVEVALKTQEVVVGWKLKEPEGK